MVAVIKERIDQRGQSGWRGVQFSCQLLVKEPQLAALDIAEIAEKQQTGSMKA